MSNIKVFCRLKPTKVPSNLIESQQSDHRINIFTALQGEKTNEMKQSFKFDGIFDVDAQQQDVFEHLAKDICDNAFKGINGTIFAQGQTGSGKTFTMTGGPERQADRGLIPRSLSQVFATIRNNTNQAFTVYVSYLEIQQNKGYDLLCERNAGNRLEDLQKIQLMSDEHDKTHIRNLSIHQASSEEDALNLLFIGDTNRVVSETPKHDASTRSHCVFMIQINSRSHDGDKIKSSKIHLVDLAGSESIRELGQDQTNMDDKKLMSEACSINGTLLALQFVIMQINDAAKGKSTWISYRSSMLTSILRDSLGGNCKTTMIANISIEKGDIKESVSTLKFSQNVASIKNDYRVNEEQDPSLVIKRLRKEIEALKNEIKLLKGQDRGPLVQEERDRCKDMVLNQFSNRDMSQQFLPDDNEKIKESFKIMKELYFEAFDKGGGKGGGGGSISDQDVKDLRGRLKMKENEINLLMNLIKKKGINPQDGGLEEHVINGNNQYQNNHHFEEDKENNSNNNNNHEEFKKEKKPAFASKWDKLNITDEELMNRDKAFEVFKSNQQSTQAFEDNKNLLKEKIKEAKSLGQDVAQNRTKINTYKNEIEKIRSELAVQGIVNMEDEVSEDPKEVQLREKIEGEKKEYHHKFNQLRELKKEIDNMQKWLEKNREKLQKDFEAWLINKRRDRGLFEKGDEKAFLNETIDHMENQISTANQSKLNSTQMTVTTNIRDQNTNKNIERFQKLKEEMESQMK